jgi:phosphoenolpyruvate carboxylase
MLDDPHKALRDDVRLLGTLLGETLRRQEGQALYDRVERVRRLAKRARGCEAADSREAFDALAGELAAMPVDAALPVARAFAHFLNLANVAEQHHRVRRRRAHQQERDASPQPGSIEDALPRLAASGIAPGDLHDAVCHLRIELVLTAHPTETMRRTLQRKYHAIAEALGGLDRPDVTPRERDALVDRLRVEITAAWETDEARGRPSPLDEIRSALGTFEQTLWDAVPEFLRSLDRTLQQVTGRPLPLDAAPIRFGSWIGGDRDGNPAVTPEVTRRACLMARWEALSLYAREVDALREELSMNRASRAVLERTGGAHDPYRALLRDVRTRLEATRRAVEDRLALRPGARTAAVGGEIYETAGQLAAPLQLCFESLHETGNGVIAGGRLTDVLRRLAVFGLTLVRLDVRQEAARHTEAVDLIARQTGHAGYAEWPEERRVRFLADVLAGDPRAIAPDLPYNPRTNEVLETFRTLAGIPPESLGACVITMAGKPSDVLAVELLQRRAGVHPPMRVVPLFETAADLRAAGRTMDDLFAIPWYRERLARDGGRQEVMVGYSDSAKQLGRVAAAWELYMAQEAIVDACRAHGIAVTLFHGRGGSVGRGGGPTYLAIQSQPPGSIDGTLRVTEQGEMIQAKFGMRGIALRTLEVYLSATLEAALASATPVPEEWRGAMDRLAAGARTAYQRTVYDDPRFPCYFRAATPEAEIDALHIGSRPARRSAGGLHALRAIPWQFAWTQTRLLLASWLGAEELEVDDGPADAGDRARAREMYRDWPFFRSMVDLMQMALAKADAGIAEHYDRQLVPAELQPIAAAMRGRLRRATGAILSITGQDHLLADNAVLRRSIEVRNPYVDPINVVQVELLRRLAEARAAIPGADPAADDSRARDVAALRRALRITINGIAAGMRNTG